MLQYDALTNLVFLLVDGAFLLSLALTSKKSPQLGSTLMMLLVLSLVGFVLSNAFYVVAGLRSFAMLRSLGHFLFWHLSFCLFASAFLHRRSRLVPFGFIAGAGILLSVYVFAYHIEPYRLEVTEFEFTHPALDGLQRPIVIAQVADIQTDRVGSYERRVLERLAELSPDLILYCGDFVQLADPEEDKAVSTKLHALIQELVPEPPLGSYTVLGDADSPQIWQPLLKSGNIRLLKDQSVQLGLPGVAVDLVGLAVDTSHTGHPAGFGKAFSDTRSDSLNIVFGHGPDHVAHLNESHAPFLDLAGHTHGGQVQFPFVGPLITFSGLPNRLADAYEPFGPGFLSVSRGIGMERIEAPRLRFLCRPELRLITLKPSGAQ